MEGAATTLTHQTGVILAGRFQAEALLKQGHGVATWLGRDLDSGARIVTKVAELGSVAETTRHRLEHEAHVLGGVEHPGLRAAVAVGEEQDLLYVVMPYVEGGTLEARLAGGPLPVLEAVRIGRRLFEALAAAHAAGVVHRDVKPGNVIVGEDAVVLIDFGLARSARLAASIRELPVGTVRYLSPEQAGLIRASVDESSDLYSAGLVLYESLAGRLPSEAGSVSELLRQQLSAQIPSLRSLGLDVPRALDEVLQRLLRKDPRDRYHSATGVVADLRAIEAALVTGASDPAIVCGLYDERRSLTEPAFVSRTRELSALEDALARTHRGDAPLVLVEAESGGGKTRLLEELADRAGREGAWVLRGQGIDASASRPFHMLLALAADVAAAAEDPALAAALRGRLGDRAAAVVTALPVLASVLGAPQGDPGPEAHGETRTLQAFHALLEALGDGERPAVLLLDDCQWADEPTLKLLRHLDGRSGSHVLVVAAFRTEEVDRAHALRRLTTARRIELGPLAPEEVQELAESMAGPLPAQAVDVLQRLSGGSPFMASAVLRGLVEGGALVRDVDGWRVHPQRLAEARSSRRAGIFLVSRLSHLPPEALALLRTAAVVGREFDVELATRLAGRPVAEALHSIDLARQSHVVWLHADDDRATFVHDKLREALLEGIGDDERRALHRRAAQAIEARDRSRCFEIAYHFDAAGEPAAALPYALEAARRARARYALELATQQLLIAERAAVDAPSRAAVAESLGDVLVLRGRYAEAEPQLRAALELAGRDDLARLEGKLGDLLFKCGDRFGAAAALEGALGRLGRRVPQGRLAATLLLAWEVLVQAAHSLAPRLFVGRHTPTSEEILAIGLYSKLAHAWWFTRDKEATAWAHLRDMNMAERHGPSAALAQAYAEHSPAMTLIPWFGRGIAYAGRAVELRRLLGDEWGEGQALHFLGLGHYGASDYRACIARCTEAVRLFERTGDQWERNNARINVGLSHYRLGELARALELARDLYRDGREIGDAQATGHALGIWAKATDGRVPEALLARELEREVEDVQVRAELLQAEGLRLMRQGRSTAAVRALEEADRRVREAGLQQEYVAPVLPWLATARRLEIEGHVSPYAPDERARLVRLATRTVRRALKLSRSYRNNLPHALREAGLLAAIRGRGRRARALLHESLEAAVSQDARYEAALTREALARLAAEQGLPNAAQDLARADAELAALRAQVAEDEAAADPVTLSLADRFDALLDVGREVASALTEETVLDALRRGALTLLRAECAAVLRLGPDGSPAEGDVRTLGAPVSRSVVQRAVAEHKAVVAAEAGGATESMELVGLRAVLCAPIKVRGNVTACVYATHAGVGSLFDQEAERIATFLATLGGAALENAAGFAALRDELQGRRRAEQALAERALELARSNDELERFAYVASHDLQEPLRIVLIYSDLLERRHAPHLDDEGRSHIRFVTESARRMRALIEGLLEYSRVDARPVQLARVHCEDIVYEALANVQALVEETGATVEVGPMPVVEADRAQLVRVFQNLLSNACKFHRAGEPPRVEVRVAEEPGGWVFSVSDRGIGFEPEYASRIFDIFQRLHGRGEYPGSGVGLAIVKRTVERHQGRIWVESKPGEGSTFSFTLPR